MSPLLIKAQAGLLSSTTSFSKIKPNFASLPKGLSYFSNRYNR